MIYALCAPSDAFSMISLLWITKFVHDTYQIEAEYLSYRTVSFIVLLIRNLKI